MADLDTLEAKIDAILAFQAAPRSAKVCADCLSNRPRHFFQPRCVLPYVSQKRRQDRATASGNDTVGNTPVEDVVVATAPALSADFASTPALTLSEQPAATPATRDSDSQRTAEVGLAAPSAVDQPSNYINNDISQEDQVCNKRTSMPWLVCCIVMLTPRTTCSP